MSEFLRPATNSFNLSVIRSRLLASSRRYRLGRLTIIIAIGLILGSRLNSAQTSAAASRDQWGTTAQVLVIQNDREAGDTLRSDDFAWVDLPVVAMPADATTSDPTGMRVSVDVAAGEILRDRRLAPFAPSALGARLNAGHVGLTLDVEADIYVVGDRVDLFDALDAYLVVSFAAVVDVGDGQITVATPADLAPAVIRSLSFGGVAIGLVG